MINFKNLSKALKHTRSSQVYWFRTEKYSYLLTGYWAIRTTKRLHVEKGIFPALINLFQDIPEISKGLQLTHKGVEPMKEEQIKNFVELIEKMPETEIKYTGLFNKRNNMDEDVILKSPSNYIFINKIYMDFIDDMEFGTNLFGKGPCNAIYAQNGEEIAMILPVRYSDIPEYLKSIQGADDVSGIK